MVTFYTQRTTITIIKTTILVILKHLKLIKTDVI